MRMFVLLFVLVFGSASARGAEPKVIHDIVYGHKDGLALTYDVITPADDVERNGATVALMVSGGWVSKWFPAEMLLNPQNSYGRLIRALLGDGYSIAIIRHGSAPKYDALEATNDVKKALEHLRNDLPKHGLDPERIGVFGFSAGGHLSLMLGTMGGKELPRWVKNQRGENGGQDAPVAAVVAWFAPTDLRLIVGPSKSFPALDFEPDDAPGISPLLLVDAGDAPTLLLHGDADRLVPLRSSSAIHEALEAAAIETKMEVFEGAGHGFRGEQQREAEKLAKAWFDRWLLSDSESEKTD